MSFDINKSEQIVALEKSFETYLYSNLNRFAKEHTHWARLSGLVVGPLCGVTAISSRVAVLAEDLIKGFCHIGGNIFQVEGCDWKVGAGNILDFFIHIVKGTFICLWESIVVVLTVFIMAINPVEGSDLLWTNNDPQEKVRRLIDLHDKNPEDDKIAFDLANLFKKGSIEEEQKRLNLLLAISEKPDSSNREYKDLASYDLGVIYHEGKIVEKDLEKAIAYHTVAVKNNLNSTSKLRLGQIYEEKFFAAVDLGQLDKAGEFLTLTESWYKKAAPEYGLYRLTDFRKKLNLLSMEVKEHFLRNKVFDTSKGLPVDLFYKI